MKNPKYTTLICGLAAIIATVIFYFLSFDSIFVAPMRWVSLLLLLITECIGMIKILLALKGKVVRASIFTSCAHLVLLILISILFLNSFPNSLKTYILLNILLFCVLVAADLFVTPFGKNLSASNKKLAQSQGVMDACYVKAQGLVIVYEQSKFKKDLVEIVELIKYSDNSELTGDEAVLMSKLETLEAAFQESNESISALLVEIKNMIKLRTIKMKSIKRGGY